MKKITAKKNRVLRDYNQHKWFVVFSMTVLMGLFTVSLCAIFNQMTTLKTYYFFKNN